MINENSINEIYDMVIEGRELITKNLNQLGFKSNDLNKLIEDGILIRVQRGVYSLNNVDELFAYGKKLFANKEYDKATKCFNKCYEIDPNHALSAFQLFLRAVKVNDYETAVSLYDKISNTDNEYSNQDAKFYLFLLSLVTQLPEEYVDYVNGLTYEDIKLSEDDNRFCDIESLNYIRKCVLYGKISYAVHKFNDRVYSRTNLAQHELVLKYLLHSAAAIDREKKLTILELVKGKEYEKVIEYLLVEERKHKLFVNDEYILFLSQKLVEIRDTMVIPQCEKYDGDSIFIAIKQNDYDKALLLSSNYNEKIGMQDNENPINILLTEICELIKSLSNDMETNEVKNDEVESKEENLELNGLTTIVSYLLKKDYDNAYNSLNKYLESMNKQNYEYLIKDLIHISILENDISCAKALISLASVVSGTFKFDVLSYLSEFYIALSQNKMDVAKIYLDIISKSKLFGGEEIDTDVLYQLLGINKVKEEIEIKEEVVETPITEPVVVNNVITKPVKLNKITKPLEIKEKDKTDEIYVSKKYNELVANDGVLLLNLMDEERAKRILDIVSRYSDMLGYTIGEGNKTQVVLVYRPKIKERYNFKELLIKAGEAYINKNYQECVDINLLLLKLSKTPMAKTYIKLGLSYVKLHDKESALKYLTIANDLAHKEEGNTFDCSNLIFALQGGFDSEESRAISKIHMSENDFDSDNLNDYFGFENFYEINDYIAESELDLESACEQLEMTPEEINILRLVYAREYYIMSNFKTGDLFLNTVERSKDKTPRIKKLIKEIREGRKFYQTRILPEARPNVLVLKPKKSLNTKSN